MRRTVALLLLAAACREPEPLVDSLNLAVDSSTSTIVARLSQPPNQVSLDSLGAQSLTIDLEVHSPDLGDIADLWELPGGRIAVLDRPDRTVVVFDSAGTIIDTLAHGGEGPGELGVPWAIAAVGSRLVVLQQFPAGNMLTSIPIDSGASVAKSPPVPADWGMLTERGPNVLLDFPIQTGIEDWTRRLTVLDDSSFVVAMRDSDSSRSKQPHQVRYLRFATDLSLRDTLATTAAPATVSSTPGGPAAPPVTQDQLFSARPWMTSGAGWYALGSGDSAHGTVHFANGTTMRLEWPSAAREVTAHDRLAAAHWAAIYTTRAFTEAREQFRVMTPEQREVAERQYLGVLPFAATVPELSGAFGGGNCVWLAGFSPRDFFDGTALTLVGINLAERKLVGPIRLAGQDLRIRHVTRRGIYVKRFNDNDEPVLVRYRIPDEAGC